MTTTARRLAAAFAFGVGSLVGACDSPTVPLRPIAYDFLYDGFGDPIVYRWPTGSTIGVYVVPGADAAATAELEAAFRHTASAWNAAVLYGEYRLVEAELQDADVVLSWANRPLPLDISHCPPFGAGAAWTTFCADSTFTGITSYPITEGEHRRDGVHMIVQVIDDPSTQQIVPALVAHEFGHVLGIGTHPCHLGTPGCTRAAGAHESLMYDGLPERATPSTADRATIEVLYHTRPHMTP